MKIRAAIDREAGQPLGTESIDLEGRRAGEVSIEVRASGICHTDRCATHAEHAER